MSILKNTLISLVVLILISVLSLSACAPAAAPAGSETENPKILVLYSGGCITNVAIGDVWGSSGGIFFDDLRTGEGVTFDSLMAGGDFYSNYATPEQIQIYKNTPLSELRARMKAKVQQDGTVPPEPAYCAPSTQ